MAEGRVWVAISGGKDSTAAILILKNRGYDVHAVTMQLGIAGEVERIARVRHLADVLRVPLRVVDLAEVFQRRVIEDFVAAYQRGLTPNPCVVCNVNIKFNELKNWALGEGKGEWYATGHYAAIGEGNGRRYLKEPKEGRKSQIYFLSMIGPEGLDRTVFPLAGHKLAEVRSMVSSLPLANEKESQDVCFLQDLDLMSFLRRRLPRLFEPGDILDISGRAIGRHDGVVNFTIGQRRGTRFSSDRKLYVVNKDIVANTITLGEDSDLLSDRVVVKNPVCWREVVKGEKFHAKVRYLSHGSEIEIVEAGVGGLVGRFVEPVRAVTPGQVAVFYDGDAIVAAGFIV